VTPQTKIAPRRNLVTWLFLTVSEERRGDQARTGGGSTIPITGDRSGERELIVEKVAEVGQLVTIRSCLKIRERW